MEHKIQTMKDKETLQKRLEAETRTLASKTEAIVKIYSSMLESFGEALRAPEGESAVFTATDVMHQLEAMADVLTNAKYELRRYCDRVEHTECDLLNLSE